MAASIIIPQILLLLLLSNGCSSPISPSHSTEYPPITTEGTLRGESTAFADDADIPLSQYDPSTQTDTEWTGFEDFIKVKDGKLVGADGKDLRLFGVNFQTPISWEFNRLSSYGVQKTAASLNAVTDANIEDLALMGVNHLRCHLTPADFTDQNGALDEDSPYIDALDYMIFKAASLGMHLSFAFINHMGQWGPGTQWVGNGAASWIQDENVVECSRRYIRSLINHTNRYTGEKYKDCKAIAFWELINEPVMYSYSEIRNHASSASAYDKWLSTSSKQDSKTSYYEFRSYTVKSYINRMMELLKEEGDPHPVCWGLNWHRFRKDNADIFDGVAASNAQIVAFCNYPGQDNSGQDYWKKTLNFTSTDFSSWFIEQRRDINGYGWVLSDQFAGKAKISYEFETFFNQSAYLYALQATFFRSLDVQTATMWTYSFNEIAPYLGGSHYLNLRCTPHKAASFLVASRIFQTLPFRCDFSSTPNEQYGRTYHISKSRDCAVFGDGECYINSNDVSADWCSVPCPGTVRHIAGCGNSPLVSYQGSGMYFIDETPEGLLIRLLPDVSVVGEIFNSSSSKQPKVLLSSDRAHSLSIHLSKWENLPCVLYSLSESGVRTSLGSHRGSMDLDLKPGTYLLQQNN